MVYPRSNPVTFSVLEYSCGVGNVAEGSLTPCELGGQMVGIAFTVYSYQWCKICYIHSNYEEPG